ncbi:esterase-like activity of phytase family protein [Rhizohabitans arisaemae]|uniref:esterase-like activity of phytase family protein n=1 Tax=Rhizohabitans arisaemae TaxID=2720610 RepID=UPI0024B13284|nr:esterase-like activity of phytase family protein [Rhizohabitans arisaemae]
MTRFRRLAGIAVAVVAAIGAGGVHIPPVAAESLAPGDFRITRFLGEQRLPHGLQFEETTFGGISGLDRDPLTGLWYLISDDRRRYNPSRFYTGRLDINPFTGAFTGVRLTGTTTLLQPDGSPYPGFGHPGDTDPETIRFDRWSRRLLWASEGDRPDASRPTLPLSDMTVRWSDDQGRYRGELPLPANLQLTDTTRGPRRNSGFEGLTFTPTSIAAMVEGPRFEDGEPPTLQRGAPARITVWNRAGQPRAQYAYPIDPLPAAPIPPTGATDSGVSEILALDDHRYLALERSWIEGVNYKVKLYEIDLRGATNILSRDSLAAGAPYRPVTKRLIHDLSTFRPPTQNLEALAFGPRLATGECTVVIGSDDNFDNREVTQFLAFAARGC